MMASKLTKNDIERVLPILDKQEAIEQTERFVAEYENSKKEFEEIIEKIDQMIDAEAELEKEGN